jgi:hypothetical protein
VIAITVNSWYYYVMQRNLMIRRVGPRSYGLTIPAEYIRECGLCDGDSVLWDSTADVAMLRFIKVMTQRPTNQLGQNGQVEQEATESAE